MAKERTRTPNLRATLVLTTNEEPGEALVRDVEAAGRDLGLEIDLWSRSRLSHFLDNRPTGQWIRRSFLNIEQEQLSSELLHELSKLSLELYSPPDNPIAWIPRALDAMLTISMRRDVTFLMAGSGLGKSVACHRQLAAHVESGGCGLIVPHEVIASTMTLEQAVMTTLRQLHPCLAEVGASALSFCSPEQPLLLVVEDLNHSGQAQRLAEKLAGWRSHADEGLDQRRSLEALEIISAAVEHRGTRKDLGALSIHEGIPETAASQLIADTSFAVRRRSIC